MVERILKAGYLDNNVFNETNKGTPQGGLLSPLLANIALTGLEEYLNITYKELNRIRNREKQTTFVSKGNYRVVRYADDFVIFAQTKEEIEEVRKILKPYLEERGLELAEDKTSITHIKNWKWIIKKYFPQYDDEGNFIGKWTLVGPNDKNQLFKMSSIPIKLKPT